MRWREVQDDFARAVRTPSLPVPVSVRRTNGVPSTKRLNVYRNNGIVSLIEALAASFPVVRELVGDGFFRALARAYVERRLPSSPVMLYYGASFPDFIDGFGPANRVPFLADVARFEWAWTNAYHAADRDPIGVEALQTISQQQLPATRLLMHPSLQLVRSDWPVVSLWSAHQLAEPDARRTVLGEIAPEAQNGLIVRPAFDVDVRLVEAPVWRLMKAFAVGATIAEAAEQLGDAEAAEFGAMLGYVFSAGAIVAVRE